MTAKKYHLRHLDTYEHAMPKRFFIQHIHNLIHVKINGVVTLADLRAKTLEALTKLGYKKGALDAAEELFAFQKENGADDQTVVFETDVEDFYYVHFSLQELEG